MVIGFLLICVSSVLLHLFLLHKKALRTERYPAVYPDSKPTADTTGIAQGMVSSVSADRINLQVGNRRLTYYLSEGVKLPPVGSLVQVRYDNDKALEITPLAPAQNR